MKIHKRLVQSKRKGGLEKERDTKWGNGPCTSERKGEKRRKAANVQGEVPTEGTVSRREGALSDEPNEESSEA